MNVQEGVARERSAAIAQLLAWGAMGVVNVAVGAFVLRRPLLERVLIHLFDLGQMLALGLVAAAVSLAFGRWGPRRARWRYLALAGLAVAVAEWLLYRDLLGAAALLGSGAWMIWARAFPALAALSIPFAAWLGSRALRRGERLGVTTLALSLAAAHQFVLPGLYRGIHSFVMWLAVSLLAPAAIDRANALRRRWCDWPRARRIALAAIGLFWASAAVLVPPPAVVLTHLRRLPGAVVSRYKPAWFRPTVAINAPREWFRDRAHAPPTPSSGIRLIDDPPIVILVLIDAMRAEVLVDHADSMPTLKGMMATGAAFENTWSIASGTRETVSALFAGKYTSQLRWERVPNDAGKVQWWPSDDSVRFTDELANHGVHTAVVVGLPGFHPGYGLTKGTRTPILARHRDAPYIVSALTRWLSRHTRQSMFAYIHFMEPHHPYDLAGTKGTEHENYLGELRLVDDGLAKLIAELERLRLRERTLLIVSADHGEAFGEHNDNYHGSSVYEEQVRVPLVFSHPRLEPRVITNMVSLIDLAPTVLDLFGASTPGSYMGQSLLPLIVGKKVELTRPIFLDSQSGDAGMVFPDWTKIVTRDGAPELYDLRTDPGESDNLFDVRPDARARLATLEQFMNVHHMVPIE